jgi:catechol 2,3-dioxygenase-like lactoylglutathione lyase family enzyme
VARLTALHHVHLGVADLGRARAFAEDFGLVTAEESSDRCYMRGAGTDAYNLVLETSREPRLMGIAIAVESDEDLERVASQMPGASSVRPLDRPFGGRFIALSDPDGNPVHLVSGVASRSPDPLRPRMIVNSGTDKPRRGTTQYKAPLGPPQLLRLGHVGLFISNFANVAAWYCKVLGFLPSDLMYAGPPQNVVGGFYRLDRGPLPVDHHTLALFAMGRPGLHHISFEVQDSEAQLMAHRYMLQRKHSSIWGVGRHELGSHVFDVWRSPDGYRFETFSDTDLLTAESPPAQHPVEKVSLDLWRDQPIDSYFS